MFDSIICTSRPKTDFDFNSAPEPDEPCALDFHDYAFLDTDEDGEELPPWEVYYGVRLSERCPDHFWRYFDLFVRYWPRKDFHWKFAYESGFPQAKSRRTGKALGLYDDLAIELTEKHLEFDTWLEWKERQKPLLARPNPLWLGLQMPKRTKADLIDIDAKQYLLGYYRDDYLGKGPLRPVVRLPLEHLRLLKRAYDAFPDRIWCVSSETLGVHAWRVHDRPQFADRLHDENKRRLAGAGIPRIEAHPMQGRCLRRPFGADYSTVTPDGVLEAWTEQLDYFERDRRPPTFKQLVRALFMRMRCQWERWQNAHYLYGPRREKLDRTQTRDRLQLLLGEARDASAWLKAGCPSEPVACDRNVQKVISLPAQVFLETVGELPFSEIVPSPRDAKTAVAPDGLAEMRSGGWVRSLRQLASKGLDREDSIGTVAHEFAKWLYWVELYSLPEPDRRDRILRLLVDFALKKHNGFITRLNSGNKEDVLAQLTRCLDSAVRLDPTRREESLAIFARIRRKWEGGEYKYPLRLEPILQGYPDSNPPSPCLLTVMCMQLDAPLPPGVVELIQKHAGRAKVLPFATRLLNWLYNHGGRAYPARKALGQMLGYTDPNRILNYLRILERAGVLVRGESYSKGRNGKECRLTETALSLFGNFNEKGATPSYAGL